MRLLRSTLWGAVAVVLLNGCAAGNPSTPVTSGQAPASSVEELRHIISDAHMSQHTVAISAHMDGPDPLDQYCRVRFTLPKAARCELTRRGERVGVVSVPGALYVSRTMSNHRGQTQWEELDPPNVNLSEFDGVLAQIAGEQAGIADDVVLTPGISTITATSVDTVADRPATRYDLDIDVRALYRSMAGQAVEGQLRRNLERFAAIAGPATAHIWIDSDDLPALQVLHGPTGTETIHYSDWGAPVDITPPAPDR